MGFFQFNSQSERTLLTTWLGSLVLEVIAGIVAYRQATPSNLLIYEAGLYILNSFLFFWVYRAFSRLGGAILVFIFLFELTFFGYLLLNSATTSF